MNETRYFTAEARIRELETENTALRADRDRLYVLASLVWESRWVCEEEDYQHCVGIATEIRSGNMKGIDAARATLTVPKMKP